MRIKTNSEDKFSERIVTPAPLSLVRAVECASKHGLETKSAYVRRALVRQLSDDGITIEPSERAA